MLDLPVGTHAVGPPSVDGAAVSPCAELVVSPAGAVLRPLGSAAPALDGRPVTRTVAVSPGQLIAAGDSRFTIGPARADDAAVEPAGPGSLAFVRPPRLLPAARPVRLTRPARPPDRPRRHLPWVTVLAPLLLGFVMALVTRQARYLLFAVASPAMALGNVVSDRRTGAKDHRLALEQYDAAVARLTDELAAALGEETTRRREEHPDPAAVVLTATLPTRRLWERRRNDPDALVVRVGLCTGPAEVVVEATRSIGGTVAADRPQHVHDVPAVVSLREVGVLAVAGPDEALHGLLRWLVLQLAVHHPPRDLTLTLLTPRVDSAWSFLRWLPHARPTAPEGPTVLVGHDPGSVLERVTELAALVEARRDELRELGRVEAAPFPAHVLIVDGYRALRTTPGLAAVLQDGPDVGVYAICADELPRFLPETAQASVLIEPERGRRLQLRRSGAPVVTDVLGDRLGAALAMAAARALAPLRDVRPADEAALPEAVGLLGLLDLEPPTPDGVRAAWQRQGRSTSVVLGAALDGPYRLDLGRDGPHLLVAGTTGAGKSELLQSMIASLAAAHRPDALNLVLVDYKGGSAFKDCVALPHTVGMVTDLDAHLVERALTSLGAELRSRERRLSEAGVKDLDDYVDLREREPGRPAMPRLLLVIDEFASMATELPDFVKGLVDIARRGRSLGLHLVLATQRPSGVVSAEIRANITLRLCLRVTDPVDSTDVLGTPDAARLPKATPGRVLARLGHGTLVPFQCARVGGRRPATRTRAAGPAVFVAPLPWNRVGGPAPRPPDAEGLDSGADPDRTDLAALVAAVREACCVEGIAPQSSPWLPALPGRVLLADLGPVVRAEVGGFPIGLQDLPTLQQQRTASFAPARDGHLLVIGAPGSGRSQLLQTLAASVAQGCSTADVHVYGLDCGNGALLPLRDLPHCGAVVNRTQTERAVRLLSRLAAEVDRRQALLAEGGFVGVSQQQRQGSAGQDRLPRLLLLLDRWEGFTSTLGELDGGRLTEVVLGLLREGASVGVHLVVTGDRSLASGRIASLTDSRLVLRLHDRSDYALLGLPRQQVPDTVPPGRAFFGRDGTQTQVALLDADDSGQAQANALAVLAAAARARDADVPAAARPWRVDQLPSRLTVQDAAALLPADASPLLAVVGVGGDELQALGPDFGPGRTCFVIAGPGRSGRSAALLVMARSLLSRGTAVVAGAPRASPLRALAGEPGVRAIVTDAAAPELLWRELLDGNGETPLVLLLDDAEVLRDCPAAAVFRDVVSGTLGPDRFLVLAGHAEGICLGLSGWQVEARKSRQGLLLSPQGGADGDLIGVRLPRSAVGQPVQPGRGLLHLGDGRPVSVAIPRP